LSQSSKNLRRPLIAANWKMYKTSLEAQEFIIKFKATMSSVNNRDVVICPPFTALEAVRREITGTPLALGAQNMHDQPMGAYTGEISAAMLIAEGCRYVILGHSERRQYFGETNEWVNRKLKSALAAGLIPIVCVGEKLSEREAGKTMPLIHEQIKGAFQGLTSRDLEKLVIAYEPVWAIGTGRTATPAQAQEVHVFIRKTLEDLFGKALADTVRILYGGSIKPENIDDLMAQPDVDGGLVGGASLEVASFARIVDFQLLQLRVKSEK